MSRNYKLYNSNGVYFISFAVHKNKTVEFWRNIVNDKKIDSVPVVPRIMPKKKEFRKMLVLFSRITRHNSAGAEMQSHRSGVYTSFTGN